MTIAHPLQWRRVPLEGCLLHGHGGEACPGACLAIGSTAHDQCPRSGSYTGPAFIETTLPVTEGEREALLWSAA